MQDIAPWFRDTNWSLGRYPRSTDDAIFDGTRSTYLCTLTGNTASPASVTFAANLPANAETPILEVNSTLQTATLTLNARTAGGGSEVTIASGANIVVAGTMNFSGGNISGSVTGTLYVTTTDNGNGNGVLHVNGTNANDRPTLGVPLVLGGAGTGTGMNDPVGTVTMDYSGIAAQPLVVSANASITVYGRSTINFDSLPLQGNTIATAISNSDGLTETIWVEAGGTVNSDGNYERVVGMGLKIYGGNMPNGNGSAVVRAWAGNASAALDFTGQYTTGIGLYTMGGLLQVDGAMTFDKQASLNGGNVVVANGATLTFGQVVTSPPSVMTGDTIFDLHRNGTLVTHGGFNMSGGTLNQTGTLTAHGGFNLSGGTLDTAGSNDNNPATITMDAGDVFQLSSFGEIKIPANPTGEEGAALTINGNFTSTGGTIFASVDTSQQSQGTFYVVGNVNLSTQSVLRTDDLAWANPVANPEQRWTLFSWTGTRTGAFTIDLTPTGWTSEWDDTNKALRFYEPE